MFTGIIEGLGTITGIRPAGDGRRLAISAGFDLSGSKIGDSIAVNGACLTAVMLSGRRFEADVSPETVEKTTLKDARPGDRVNIERAVKLSGRLDGHLVAGHIDGTGRITCKTLRTKAVRVEFSVNAELARYLIPKGSVAVDGISLTVNRCDESGFEVTVIPHTAKVTTIGIKSVGDWVNIETDMIGKYVKNFLRGGNRTDSPEVDNRRVDIDFLHRTGFL